MNTSMNRQIQLNKCTSNRISSKDSLAEKVKSAEYTKQSMYNDCIAHMKKEATIKRG